MQNEMLDNKEINKEENNQKKQIDKKVLISVLVLIGILIILVIVSFLYIKFKFTAPKFIDAKVAEFSASVDKMLTNYKIDDFEDISLIGDIGVNTNIEEASYIKGTKLNFKGAYSNVNKMAELDFELFKNDNSIFDGNMYINDDKAYFDFQSLYNQVLYTDLEESIFNNTNIEELFFNNKLKNTIKNLVNYMALAIKEGDMQSSLNGVRAVYTYSINENNKEKVLKKLNELISKDEDVLSIFELMDFDGEITDISNVLLKVEVKIPSGEVVGFDFIVGDYNVTLKEVKKNNYKLIVNENVTIDIVEQGNNINLFYKNSEGTLDATFNKVNCTMNVIITTLEQKITYSVIDAAENTKEIKMIVEYGDYAKFSFNGKIISDSDNSLKINGILKIESEGYFLELEYNMGLELGNNLVLEKEFSNAKDINTLTDEEQLEISNKLMDTFKEFIPALGDINDTDSDKFLLNSNAILDIYEVYKATDDSRCITVGELIDAGYIKTIEFYEGVFVRNNDGSYNISLTDGVHMIVNKTIENNYLDVSDVQKYDASIFNSFYQVCGDVL